MADRGMTSGSDGPKPGGGGTTRLDRSLGRFFIKLIAVMAAFAVLILVALWGLGREVHKAIDPDPVTIARASLQGIREQNRLSAFQARYVAVVTSTQSQFGISTQKTLIMPGTVDYSVDLAKLTQRDVRWDAASKTLLVTLPPVEISSPAIDMAALREYGSGGLLSSFTHADQQLDQANRTAGQAELLHQARAATPMNLARDATRRAVEHSFALPLRAAGIPAQVKVRFPEDGTANDERWDTSRSLDEVMANTW